jgi:hypothetical protein
MIRGVAMAAVWFLGHATFANAAAVGADQPPAGADAPAQSPASVITNADPDLDLPPDAATPQPQTHNAPISSHIYAQGDLTFDAARHSLVVPLPVPASASSEARLFLDTRITDTISQAVSVTYSGRFNLRTENSSDFPAREVVRNDLREAYLTWQSAPDVFIEIGRINLKNGVAEGFNPTDYFKTRAVVEADSADPTVLREDRLGTAMVLAEAIGPKGSLSFALAPKLSSNSPPYLDTNLPRFDPMLDRTNANTRALVKASFQLFSDVSPELLAYYEAGHARLGLNVTKGLGQATILYLEWSGGRRASLADDAYQDGIANHVLPMPPAIPVTGAQSFANDVALGGGYTTKIGIHIDLEYDYHQAGFSSADWRHFFDAGKGADVATLNALWFTRSYANDQQEPIARNSIFLSADWSHAFVRDLNLAAFADTDLRDGSSAGQFSADYFVTPAWTIGGLVDFYYGKARSNFGSVPQESSILLKMSRYF